jgi:hypothetical protein
LLCYYSAESMTRNTPPAAILPFAFLSLLLSALEARPAQQKHPARAEAEKIDLHIVGEVSGERTFEQDIGHDLLFRLTPPQGGENAGWIVEVVPKMERDDGPIEFSAVATPPYHAYNERCVATVYGRSASDVVKLKDRAFFFVESIDDEHRAEEVVNAALYPTNISDEDRVRIAEEQKQIRLGKGELHILKAHIGRSQVNDWGTIDSLRFGLDIELSSGVTMANIIARVARPE